MLDLRDPPADIELSALERPDREPVYRPGHPGLRSRHPAWGPLRSWLVNPRRGTRLRTSYHLVAGGTGRLLPKK
jgi:hypothetical protein